jgi:hypothetical protein
LAQAESAADDAGTERNSSARDLREMSDLILLVTIGLIAGLFIGFVFGYGVRASMSRHRRRKVNDKWPPFHSAALFPDRAATLGRSADIPAMPLFESCRPRIAAVGGVRAWMNADSDICRACAICFRTVQKGSSRLTLVLCLPITIERLTIADFISARYR